MVTYKLLTNPGDRTHNEDASGMLEEQGAFCFVVADGLGGHGKGEVASAIAIESSLKAFYENPKAEDYISRAFQISQDNILKRQNEERADNKMKTTLVVLRVAGNKAVWGHIGDSRLYHFYNNRLKERTLDHSVPQMLVATREIREKDIRHHPDRNRLLRVMGTPWDEPRYQVAEEITLKEGKRHAFLLCSDGFWELIEEKKMMAYLKKSQTVEEWILQMEQEVKKNGQGLNMDNYTACGVFVEV